MLAKEPSIGVKASTMAFKVMVARVPAIRWVESSYTLQGMNMDRVKHQVKNGGCRKVDDMSNETGQGWMEEEVKLPLNNKATIVFIVDCNENSSMKLDPISTLQENERNEDAAELFPLSIPTPNPASGTKFTPIDEALSALGFDRACTIPWVCHVLAGLDDQV